MKATSQPAHETEPEAVRAAKLVEGVVGNGWATDANGVFTYMTPAALSRFGVTLEDLGLPSHERVSGWRRIVHPDDYDDAMALWRRCLRTGAPFDVEHRVLRSSGAYGWTRSSGRPVRDEGGGVIGWYGAWIDSDVPSAERERYADASSTIRERTAATTLHSLSRTHPDDRTSAAHAASRAFWTGVPQVTRHRQRQDDGSYRWTETRAEPGYSVSIDIDEVVTDGEPPDETASNFSGESEAEPLRSVRVTESLFGNGWAFDAAGKWVYLHPFAQSSLGVTLDDLNAPLKEGYTGWKRVLHPDDYDEVAAAWRHCLETGDNFNVEFRFRRASGTYVWARTAARPTRDRQGRITGWYGIALDIDVYKKTVSALRDRERELSRLVDMVPGHLWRLSPDGEPVFFNKRMTDFFGLTVDEMDRPGMSRLDALIHTVHPDDAENFRGALTRSLATGETFSMRYRARRADGAYRWMTSRAEPMHGQDGRIVQWYGLCQDIDDQMHAEEAVRQSERQLQELVDALPINILSFAPSGEITYASKRYLDRVGPPPPHIENFNMLAQALAHPDDFPEMFSRASNGFATGQPFVNRFRRRDRQGIYRWIEARAQPLRDASGAVVQWYIISIDIEEERRAQDELRIARENLARQSQAASLAELSASIAHEVNQPLAAIVANSHACQRWLSAEPPNVERGQKTVARIIRDANSAADVVSRVRALFKQSMDTHVHAEIGDVIAQVRDLIAEEASRHHVRVQIDIDDSLPIIPLDGVQIQQVLINLIRNGIEAMTGMPGDRVLGLHVHEFENSIRVEIRDRGEGIKFPDKIFEPFFTTKDHGMGMGLAICRSIVESHGGRLWAEKNEPLGSAFIFTLPIPADPVS